MEYRCGMQVGCKCEMEVACRRGEGGGRRQRSREGAWPVQEVVRVVADNDRTCHIVGWIPKLVARGIYAIVPGGKRRGKN